MNNDPQILFDELGRVKSEYILSIIAHLCSLTPEKTQTAIARAIDVAQSVISQMKNGTTFLYRKHLVLFAQKHGLSVDALLTLLVQNVHGGDLLSSVSPHTAHTSEPPKINDVAFIIADEKKREKFLTALQEALAIKEGVLFLKHLNQDPQSDTHTNYQIFILTGQVPLCWMRAIIDTSTRDRIRNAYDPKCSTDIIIPPPQPDIPSAKESAQKCSSQTCMSLSTVPKEFLDGFFHACIAAGKAVHLQLAAEAFLGTLSLKLRDCSITSRWATSKDILIVTIHNGKNRIDYHLNLNDLS